LKAAKASSFFFLLPGSNENQKSALAKWSSHFTTGICVFSVTNRHLKTRVAEADKNQWKRQIWRGKSEEKSARRIQTKSRNQTWRQF
jgi:hypothetical protein